MDPYSYRIGKQRALHTVTCLWFAAATIIGTMTYPQWTGVGESSVIGLMAMAQGPMDLLGSADREIVSGVLRSHGVQRKPGQTWPQVLQSLKASKVTGIADDLEKKFGASASDRSTQKKGRRTTRPANGGQRAARQGSRVGSVLPGTLLAPGRGAAPWARMLRGK